MRNLSRFTALVRLKLSELCMDLVKPQIELDRVASQLLQRLVDWSSLVFANKIYFWSNLANYGGSDQNIVY